MSKNQVRDQGAHRLRKRGLRERCPVCGVEAYMRCIEPAPRYENKGVREYAEFRLLAAASDLKEVDPDHILVRAIELVLDSDTVAPGQQSFTFYAE